MKRLISISILTGILTFVNISSVYSIIPQDIKTVENSVKKSKLSPREFGYHISRGTGMNYKQWNCLDRIIWKESRWNPKSQNKTSSAWGLGQILKSKKRVGHSVRKQMLATISYIEHRYDTPCKALAFHKVHNWY